MARPLDLARLQHLCGSPLPQRGGGKLAFDVVRELDVLGDLWLVHEVRLRAHAFQRESYEDHEPDSPPAPVPLQRGECGILLATENAAAVPLLRRAFVLPVEWRRERVACPKLPRGLSAFAATVLSDLKLEGLSLHLPDRLAARGIDLSTLHFDYDSAWATLAAGAIVADQRGATFPDVMVSAAWERENTSRGYLGRVDHVSAKLDAAVAAGARVVFLPRENRGDADAWRRANPAAGLDLRELSNVDDMPARALARVLEELEVAPTRATCPDFAQRSRYFTRLPPSRKDQYHQDELLDEVVDRLRSQIEVDARLEGNDRLVLVTSTSWSLACLVVRLFDPANVLLLHDGRLEAESRSLLEKLPTIGRGDKPPRSIVPAECRRGQDFYDEVGAAVASFAAAAGRVVVDLTGGDKEFSMAILSALPANALATHVAVDQDATHRSPVPGTERIRVLRSPPPAGSGVSSRRVRPRA